MRSESPKQWTATCPFCNREGKLGLNPGKSQFNCVVCGEHGNNYDFIRKVLEMSLAATDTRDYVRAFKQFDLPTNGKKFAKVAAKWQLAKHAITGEWCLPGYNATGSITGLYVWRKVPVKNKATGTTVYKYQLRCSPGMGQHLLGYEAVFGSKPAKAVKARVPEIDICEGWRDGVAWQLTTDRPTVSIPGVNSWREDWQPVVTNRVVNILFDNDWPTTNPRTKAKQQLGGPAGVDKIGRLVLSPANVQAKTAPKELRYLDWAWEPPTQGSGLPVLPTNQAPQSSKHYVKGADLRDITVKGLQAICNGRKGSVAANHPLKGQTPLQWVRGSLTVWPATRAALLAQQTAKQGGTQLTPKKCQTWRELTTVWKDAMRWRRDLSDVLAIMMATAISTLRMGDQLFVMVIGPPGCGKTRLCEAMLVSKNTMSLEMLTGVVSGWKTGQGAGKKYSLLERGNNKCWITPEADTMVKDGNYSKEMGRIRRAFDGSMTADFKTMDEALEFNGLRLTWIKAGTPKMLTHDMAGLGDRFLKIRIHPPSFKASLSIVNHVIKSAWDDVANRAEGEHHMNEKYQRAYEMTAGYLDYMIDQADDLLEPVEPPTGNYATQIARLAYMVSYFRARPDADEEVEDVVEQPNRVAGQLVRYARCLTVVLNKTTVDDEVMRVVTKLGEDSSAGYTYDVAKVVASHGPCGAKMIQLHCGRTDNAVRKALAWLTRIKVLEMSSVKQHGYGKQPRKGAQWQLTALGRWLTGLDEDYLEE